MYLIGFKTILTFKLELYFVILNKGQFFIKITSQVKCLPLVEIEISTVALIVSTFLWSVNSLYTFYLNFKLFSVNFKEVLVYPGEKGKKETCAYKEFFFFIAF